MIIANPIYDVVFKYLLEDTEIARELLSTILSEDVIALEVKPQETTTENPASSISILRFDFKAIIRLPDGETKKVLIELQKAKQVFDVMRFRRYLGENYRKEDDIISSDSTIEKKPLPIITIYFLGFRLDNLKTPVVKINREYINAITGKKIDVKEDFVELLTHDSYIIQIARLKSETKTKLERVLQVFSPEYRTKDRHQLDFQGEFIEPLVKKIIDRLTRAIASEEIRDKMDVEDEIDRIFERELNKKDKIIEEERKKSEEKDKTIELKEKAIEEKEKTIEEKEKTIEEKEKTIEEKEKTIEEKEKTIEDERKRNEELLLKIAALEKSIK